MFQVPNGAIKIELNRDDGDTYKLLSYCIQTYMILGHVIKLKLLGRMRHTGPGYKVATLMETFPFLNFFNVCQ